VGDEVVSSTGGSIHLLAISGAGAACCIEDPAEFDGAVRRFSQAKGLWPGDR
jgi:hypothetical protein